MILCPYCGNQFDNRRSLSKHFQRSFGKIRVYMKNKKQNKFPSLLQLPSTEILTNNQSFAETEDELHIDTHSND